MLLKCIKCAKVLLQRILQVFSILVKFQVTISVTSLSLSDLTISGTTTIWTCFFFFLTAENFQLILKKMKFWDNSYDFYYFGEKIGPVSRRHLSHLSMLTSLFTENISKFRVNNHFLLVFIFYSQVRKTDFWHFCYEVYRFYQLKNA